MLPDYEQYVTVLPFGDDEHIHCVTSVTDPEAATVIIPSQFEKTIRTNALMMAYLAHCGLNVVRFDFRNHNGESSGRIVNFKLSESVDDLAAVMGNLDKLGVGSSKEFGIIGISIANRTTLRYLANEAPNLAIQWYGSLLGVVDMEETIDGILGYNLIAMKRANRAERHGIKKAVKYEIDFDAFTEDCIDSRLDDLAGTQSDLAALDLPVSIVLSEQDHWVSYDKAAATYENSPISLRHRFVVPNAGHLLDKNLQSSKTAVTALVNAAAEAFGAPRRVDEASELTIPEIVTLNQREREREARYRSFE